MVDAELPPWVQIDGGFLSLIGPMEHCRVSDDCGQFRFMPDFRHSNRSGFAHGGLLLALADCSLGIAARQSNPAQRHATVQLDMHFIKAAPIGSLIELECRIASAKRSLIFMEADITVDGDLIAKAKGIWRVFDPTI